MGPQRQPRSPGAQNPQEGQRQRNAQESQLQPEGCGAGAAGGESLATFRSGRARSPFPRLLFGAALGGLEDAHPHWDGVCSTQPTDSHTNLTQNHPHRHSQLTHASHHHSPRGEGGAGACLGCHGSAPQLRGLRASLPASVKRGGGRPLGLRAGWTHSSGWSQGLGKQTWLRLHGAHLARGHSVSGR